MPNQVIWITASAGTGKTTALINRYKTLLETCRPERIVGITFTINAAQEIKDRIADHRHILRIQTIHSLCHQLLSEYTGKAISILDPHEKTVLIEQAVRMALNEPTELTRTLAERFSFYHLQNLIEKIAAHFPGKQHGTTNIPCEFDFGASAPIEPHPEILSVFNDIFWGVNLQTNYADVFLTKTGEIRKRILDAATIKKFPQLVPMVEEEAQRVYRLTQERATQEWRYDNVLIHALVERVGEHYTDLKQDRIDYDELITATQLMLEDSAIRHKICQSIDHVLLDEAQDTNPKQWRIIELLTQHLFEEPTTHKSFFVVGDHKQSIYGFQNASPEFMEQQKQKYKRIVGAQFTEESLAVNYRSVENVCDYVQAQCYSPAVQVARKHPGFVLEATNFDEVLEKFLKDPPFLPSQNRTLELQDIMILCRKRDKTYQSIIETYGDQIRFEQTQLLADLPTIQTLMYRALLMAEPKNAYAQHKTGLSAIEDRDVLTLVRQTLSHNVHLLDVVLEILANHAVTTPKSLYWWLRAYPYSVKTISTDNPHTMRLLTMHGAKGLQASVVFVFNNWSAHHQQDLWWNYDTMDFVIPPTKAIHDETLNSIREQNRAQQNAEEERLRYVAFTRAMDVLIVLS